MAKLLATDLDGTLLHPTSFLRCIPKKNVAFIRKWIDAGNRLVLVTSRGPAFMERLKKEIKRDFDYITYTSSHIVANGEIIYDDTINAERTIEITDLIYQKYHPISYLLDSKDHILAIKDTSGVGWFLLVVYWFYWFFQGKKREKYILNNKVFDEYMKNGNVYKVMAFFGLMRKNKMLCMEINKQIRETFPELECSWVGPVVEITPPNCNKGAGLDYYCKHLGISKEDVYVVGDSGNDISMFKLYHENSYVMARAYPSVKKHAKHVISRVSDLDELVLNKKEN